MKKQHKTIVDLTAEEVRLALISYLQQVYNIRADNVTIESLGSYSGARLTWKT